MVITRNQAKNSATSAHEVKDPEELLMRLTGTFVKHAIPEKKWMITAVGLTFSEFETRLKERFNNPTLVAKLTAELYKRRQKEDEAVEIFLIKKQQIFRKLQPNTAEEVLIRTLKDLRETAAHLERTVRRPATATRTVDVQSRGHAHPRNQNLVPSCPHGST
ncbi:hypothetical protein HHI36_019846 [Cryptolaemus montrouzieri]|uniref:Gag protein n=1 Tax=Cryptolaemus montrouzieri TaxID=559131 RepID=A0ABD2N9P8_9CUCU